MFLESGAAVDGSHASRRDGVGEGRCGAALPLDELEERIAALAGEINAATCRMLGLLEEFERRGGHERDGFHSCTAWLAWRCSLTPRAAREQMRVARVLAELPAIRAEFATGSLSYSKVRALTRVAEPELEEELLELAGEATAAQLERLLRAYRKAIAPDEEAEIRERRHLSTRWEDDGSLSLRGSLPAEEGALLLKAIELARAELWEDRARGRDRATDGGDEADAPAPDDADALVVLAEGVVADGAKDAAGGDRHQVVVHVDLDGLACSPGSAVGSGGGEGHPSSEASVGSGGRVCSAAARRIGCDASIVTLMERGGEPLSVGRKTRSIPPAVARALRARDGGCRFPGCGRTRFVDAHHIRHWADGGETGVENLVQLCRHHHRLVHEGGFGVSGTGSKPAFHRPDGSRVESAPALPAVDPDGRPRERRSAPVAEPRTGRLDLDHSVFVLAASRERRLAAGADPG